MRTSVYLYFCKQSLRQTMKKYLHSCIAYTIFLYFSQDVNSTISIIKSKQNCRFTHACICTEVGTVVTAQSQQMQKSNLNPGIPSLVALYKSRERFCQDSGIRKTSGIIQDALHSWFRKENICHGITFSVSNWIINP